MGIQAAMLACVDLQTEHTVLRSRDEHDGVCGLWWLLSDLELLSLNGVESFGGNACSRVCVAGDGDGVFPAKLSTPHGPPGRAAVSSSPRAMRLCARPNGSSRNRRAFCLARVPRKSPQGNKLGRNMRELIRSW